jgi:elongation factor Tu
METKKHHRHQASTICTLGGAGHGKTTLTAAIIKVVSQVGSTQIQARDLDLQLPIHHSIGGRLGVSYKAVDYETSGRHYTQVDALSHADNIKMLISGSPKIGGAILVVSAVEGVTSETESQIHLASRTRVPAVVTFLNKTGLLKDPELIDICQMEIRELLMACGYAEAKSPMILGDAERALKYKGQNLSSDHCKPIIDLIFAMNRCIPQPISTLDLPLIMPIREVVDDSKTGVSTLHGEILQGRLAVGHSIHIVGKGDRIKTRCVAMRSHTELSPPPHQGQTNHTVENQEVIQVDSEPGWLSPGQVVSDPKSIKSHTIFEAAVYVMTQEECGAHIPLVGNDKPEIHLWTINITGHLRLPSDVAVINPGEHATVQITLDLPMAIMVGTRFDLKKMGAKLGIGVVTTIVD